MSRDSGEVNRSDVGDVSATPHDGDESNAIFSVTPVTAGVPSSLPFLECIAAIQDGFVKLLMQAGEICKSFSWKPI